MSSQFILYILKKLICFVWVKCLSSRGRKEHPVLPGQHVLWSLMGSQTSLGPTNNSLYSQRSVFSAPTCVSVLRRRRVALWKEQRQNQLSLQRHPHPSRPVCSLHMQMCQAVFFAPWKMCNVRSGHEIAARPSTHSAVYKSCNFCNADLPSLHPRCCFL